MIKILRKLKESDTDLEKKITRIKIIELYILINLSTFYEIV